MIKWIYSQNFSWARKDENLLAGFEEESCAHFPVSGTGLRMSRFRLQFVFLITFLLLVSGCAPKSAKLQKSVVPPDKALFETGSEYLKKSQYIRARLAFQTLINTYPDSEMAAESYFAIGDSFYEEGGTENLIQAVDQFENFIVFFPAHPKGPDAQMKIIAANMKMMRPPDRDQKSSYDAERAIKKALERFPDSDYVAIWRRYLTDVQEHIGKGDLGVGQFYAERGNYAGALGRYKEIIEKYHDFSAMDEVYFRVAELLEKAKSVDEAAEYYAKIAAGYPFSKRFEEAKTRLTLLGKPLPPVDTQLAVLNQSRLRPEEGFTPLKPFIEFGKALGFVGPPDRYEEARKILEAEKEKVAQAQMDKAGKGEQEMSGIQIQTILRKSASGEVEDTTVLGSDTNASGQGEDKKDTSKRKNRKRNPKRPS